MTALNIKSAEAHRLAREIAPATGETLTGAVVAALRARKAELDAKAGPDPEKVARMRAMGRAYRARLAIEGGPIPTSTDDDDLCDAWGLPQRSWTPRPSWP